MMKIKDIPEENFVLITDSQEIEYILTNYTRDKKSYGCLFVQLGEGEFVKIYGCKDTIPYLNCDVEELEKL